MYKIILLGYMGSGKSTIAKIIAQKLQIAYIDLDDVIEAKRGMSISEIFDRRGEIYFRKAEHETLKEIIETQNDFVLALGGGTPCYGNNHLLINGPSTLSVYLKASIETLLDRLSGKTANRPVLQYIPAHERHEYIAKHLFDRSYFYNAARVKVVTDNKSAEESALEIIDYQLKHA